MMVKRYKWLAVIAVAVCLAAQAFVILPHHHHGESEVPCFNIVHCVEHEAGHEAEAPAECCHDHCAPVSEPVSDHQCSVRVDMPEPVNMRQYGALLDALSAFNDLYAPAIISIPEQSDISLPLTLTRRRQMPSVPDVCVLYLAEALSARAPSCLA